MKWWLVIAFAAGGGAGYEVCIWSVKRLLRDGTLLKGPKAKQHRAAPHGRSEPFNVLRRSDGKKRIRIPDADLAAVPDPEAFINAAIAIPPRAAASVARWHDGKTHETVIEWELWHP